MVSWSGRAHGSDGPHVPQAVGRSSSEPVGLTVPTYMLSYSRTYPGEHGDLEPCSLDYVEFEISGSFDGIK